MGLKEICTLGISLGTNVMGIAVLQGKELVYWQTKTIKGIWNEKKLHKCISSIDRVFRKFYISHCGIKVIHPSQFSSGYLNLLEAIEQVFSTEKIPIHKLDMNDLREHCEIKEKCPKDFMAQYLSKLYPEFNREIYLNSYYFKVQEAILSALVVVERL